MTPEQCIMCNAAFAFSFDREWCEIWQFDAAGRRRAWVLQVWFKRHCHWLHWRYGSWNQLRIWPSNLLKPWKNTEAAEISYSKNDWYIRNHSRALYTFNRLFNYLLAVKDLEFKYKKKRLMSLVWYKYINKQKLRLVELKEARGNEYLILNVTFGKWTSKQFSQCPAMRRF